jgi:hypothetical protein
MSTGLEFRNLYVIFSAVGVGSTACSVAWLSIEPTPDKFDCLKSIHLHRASGADRAANNVT